MELSITSLLYLFFRLSPFILVSYFSLSSVFNQDIKGLIYLAGLLIACFVSILFGKFFENSFQTDENTLNPVCNLITIGSMGSFSNIPLGTVMMTYTLFYLVYIIAMYNIVMYNLPTIILFPLLILGDIIWNLRNNCYGIISIVAALVIGGGIGTFWAYVIDSIKKPDLFYLNVGSNQTVCKRPSKQLYKCTFKTKE